MRECGRSRLLGVGAVAAILGLVAASCGGNGRSEPAPGDVEGLSRDVCNLVSELEQADARVRGPHVFDQNAHALGEVFTHNRELLAEITERSTGDLGRRLSEQLLSQQAMDEAILARWDQRRGALEAEHDDAPWVPRILDETVRRPDGVLVGVNDFSELFSTNRIELAVRCRAPELMGGPRQETSEDPPPGRLVFMTRIDDRPRLVMTNSRGDHLRRLADPAPWQVLAGSDAGRRGDHQVVVEASMGDEFGLVVMDDSGAVVRVVARGPGDLSCPSWNDAGDQILATDNSSDVDERRLHLIDIENPEASQPLDLPFAVVGCGAFISDDRIVVADAALSIERDRGVWTVGIDGSDPREVYTPEDCIMQGSVDPTGTQFALTQNCGDPLASGVRVLDLTTGEAHDIATGRGGPVKWSPDGDWLVFSMTPFTVTSNSVWIARANGRQLRQVAAGPSWTPVWLPAA
jgi:hypothetical protein